MINDLTNLGKKESLGIFIFGKRATNKKGDQNILIILKSPIIVSNGFTKDKNVIPSLIMNVNNYMHLFEDKKKINYIHLKANKTSEDTENKRTTQENIF